MAQLLLGLSSKLRFRPKHDRVGKAAGHDRLQLLGRVDLSGQKGDGGVQIKSTHEHFIDACVQEFWSTV